MGRSTSSAGANRCRRIEQAIVATGTGCSTLFATALDHELLGKVLKRLPSREIGRVELHVVVASRRELKRRRTHRSGRGPPSWPRTGMPAHGSARPCGDRFEDAEAFREARRRGSTLTLDDPAAAMARLAPTRGRVREETHRAAHRHLSCGAGPAAPDLIVVVVRPGRCFMHRLCQRRTSGRLDGRAIPSSTGRSAAVVAPASKMEYCGEAPRGGQVTGSKTMLCPASADSVSRLPAVRVDQLRGVIADTPSPSFWPSSSSWRLPVALRDLPGDGSLSRRQGLVYRSIRCIVLGSGKRLRDRPHLPDDVGHLTATGRPPAFTVRAAASSVAVAIAMFLRRLLYLSADTAPWPSASGLFVRIMEELQPVPAAGEPRKFWES